MSSEKWEEGDRWAWDWEHGRPLGPIVVSILAVIGWLVFILLYALFWSSGFTIFQNVIVTIVTLVIMALVIGLGWVVWGMRRVRPWRKPEQPTAAPG